MRSLVAPLLVLTLLPLVGCEARAPSEDAAAVSDDAGLDASASAREDAGPPPPPWPSGLAALDATRRDFQLRRAIVHLHSPLSHDACDGEGWVDGALVDTACFDHLRSAACTLHMDTLWLTDHAPHVEEPGFEAAHWASRPGDELVRSEAGDVIAARWACEDAHRVLVMVGSENELMPVGLLRHPSLDPAVLADPARLGAIYDADGAAAAAVFREAGALVLYAHTEGHTLEQLRGTQPDGIEIYNTHANVDPNIREEHLGLGRLDYAPMLFRFTNAAHRLEPDLALLSFLSENDNALVKWDTLLSEGARVFGTGGCDAHENTFTMEMPDGERGDSYRRMMYWHTHHLLVRGEGRDAMMEALGHGRFYLTFEALGTPVGFDFVGTDPLGATCEMGDTCAAGTTLRVVRPSLPAGFPSDPPPRIELRILRAAEGGAVEVARGTDDRLEHVTETVGAYRAEVRIVPEHARPYLGAFADELVREVPWIYSNPIYVDWP